QPFPPSRKKGKSDGGKALAAERSKGASRFRIVRKHAKGGLGQVFVAEDLELHRKVALKEIQAKFADNEEEQLRFVVEAEITGGLEHPCIVPIYGLGQYDDGRPYYAMRFVRGDTFKDAIEQFHEKNKAGRGAGEIELELRKLLRRFIDCCNAMQYAHSRGVVHRDLKPANVMLGKYGETLLVDWGLAKAANRSDSFVVDDEVSLRPFSLSGSANVTQRGTALGTPSYMSPEQAAGRIDELGPTSDIYSLGATLYHLLVGKSPQSGKRITVVFRDIQLGKFPTPREANPQIPRALEAICMKAMAMEPDDRFESAAALAEDIEHWMANETVSAYAEPRGARIARWMRHHRSWTQSIAVAVILIAVVAIVAAILVSAALASEKLAKAEALRRFQETMTVVDELRLDVADTLAYFPGLQRVRIRLLMDAAEDYERLAKDHSDDPQIQVIIGRVNVQLGMVRELVGGAESVKSAEEAYRVAEKVFRDIDKKAENTEARHELAKCLGKLAVILDHTGRPDESIDTFGEATSILDALVNASPNKADYRETRAIVNIDHARLLEFIGKPDAAEKMLRDVASELEKLIKDDAPRHRSTLTDARVTLGSVLYKMGENRQAVEIFREAIRVFQALIAVDLDRPEHVQNLAMCRIYLANSLRPLGLIEEEIENYRAAIEDYNLLRGPFPDVPFYRESLAITQVDLGQALNRIGQNYEAKQYLEEAKVHLFDLERQNGDIMPRYHEQLAAAQASLGRTLFDLDQNEDARTEFEAAHTRCAALVSRFDIPQYRHRRAAVRSNLARVWYKQGKQEDAEQMFQGALDDYGILLASDPENTYYTDGMAWTLEFLGDLLIDEESPKNARREYARAISLRKELQGAPEYQHNLALLLANCLDTESRDVKRAIDTALKLTDKVATTGKYWTVLAIGYYRDGNWEECLKSIAKVGDCFRAANSPHRFWRVMALWQRNQDDDRATAKKEFQEAESQMNKNAPGRIDLKRARDEAAKLLGVETLSSSQPPAPDSASRKG
ncbi:MAG: serine/threonine protein kinase, partial [Planctomycetes bacterium]|nr:serine/threonine protein kinase [Planctomycetota bacterium]